MYLTILSSLTYRVNRPECDSFPCRSDNLGSQIVLDLPHLPTFTWIIGGIVFFAPIALGVARGAVAPTLIAAVLSALGITAVMQGLMVTPRPYDTSSINAMIALTIIGSALWLGAMVAGLAGYAAGPSWRR